MNYELKGEFFTMAENFEKELKVKMEKLASFSPKSDFVFNYLVLVDEIMASYEESYIEALDRDDVTEAKKIAEEIGSHIDVQISSMLGK